VKRALLLAAFLVACAPTLPAAYVSARDAAESAYARGQFVQAAEYWLRAADSAAGARDRSDARYRAATSYERALQLTGNAAERDFLHRRLVEVRTAQ